VNVPVYSTPHPQPQACLLASILYIMQITLSLGNECIEVPVADINEIPFLSNHFKRWTTSTEMRLPSCPEIQSLSLLKELIDHCNGKYGDKLPENHMQTFCLVRLADFVGCDSFLCTVAEQLGTSVHCINNSNGIKYVRAHIRDAYRFARKSSQQVSEHVCSVCHKSLSSACNLPKLPRLTSMKCCGGKIHTSCSTNFPLLRSQKLYSVPTI